MALQWLTRRGRAADPARKEKHRAVTLSAQQDYGNENTGLYYIW